MQDWSNNCPMFRLVKISALSPGARLSLVKVGTNGCNILAPPLPPPELNSLPVVSDKHPSAKEASVTKNFPA